VFSERPEPRIHSDGRSEQAARVGLGKNGAAPCQVGRGARSRGGGPLACGPKSRGFDVTGCPVGSCGFGPIRNKKRFQIFYLVFSKRTKKELNR
jgi:hypothetical protein